MSIEVKVVGGSIERIPVYIERPSWKEFLEA